MIFNSISPFIIIEINIDLFENFEIYLYISIIYFLMNEVYGMCQINVLIRTAKLFMFFYYYYSLFLSFYFNNFIYYNIIQINYLN